jgi:hypothetical protein
MIARMSLAKATGIALVLLAYLAYGLLGLVYEQQLAQFHSGTLPERKSRWDLSQYAPGAERWLARDRLWHRLRYSVWIGGVVLMNVLYVALRTR